MFFGYEANLTSIIQKANMELEIWQMYVFVLVTFQRGDFQVPAASFQGGIFWHCIYVRWSWSTEISSAQMNSKMCQGDCNTAIPWKKLFFQ